MRTAKVRVGVLGIGRIGSWHLAKFCAEPGAEVVGIYDPHEDRRDAAAKQHGVTSYRTWEELLFDVDAAVVASSTAQHAPLVRACIERGVHVLVEKPCSGSAAEARELGAMAQAKGVRLHVGFLERLRVRELLGGPPTGNPRLIETVRDATALPRDTGVDVVYDLLVHDIDLVLSIVGAAPTEVRASGFSWVTDGCDWVEARLEFADGSVARLRSSRTAEVLRRKLELAYPDRFVGIDLQDNRVFSRDRGQPIVETTRPTFDALQLQASLFLASVRGETVPLATAEEAAQVLTVADAISQAIEGRKKPTSRGETTVSLGEGA